MSLSRLGALEAAGLAQLQTIGGFNEKKAVASGLFLLGKPEIYPAGWFAIINLKLIEKRAIAQHTYYMYDAECGVLIFGTSDGVSLGDARTNAWSLVDATIDAFTNFQATGLPAGTSVWPFVAGDPLPTITDAQLHAILVPLTARIAWTT
jgi:hypothetical protein